LVLHCSENNVYKLKNRHKFTWFIVEKIHKPEVCKSRYRCIRKSLRERKTFGNKSEVCFIANYRILNKISPNKFSLKV
jgi:hypothetical protein